MNTKHTTPIIIGKMIRQTSRLRGGSGSALPGLVVERMYPRFLEDMLKQLPDGVVIVTGTNGKTTTTKVITGALELLGKKVLTNPSGSNFTRGIVSTVINNVSIVGKLEHDIAVLELDEAYAVQFIKRVKPRYVLALNVMRDQLDRFGEVDATARLIQQVIASATKSVVINADDPHLFAAAKTSNAPVFYYGVDESLRAQFPTDDELLAKLDKKPIKQSNELLVKLKAYSHNTPTFLVDKKAYVEPFQIQGGYNYQNIAGAFALIKLVIPSADNDEIIEALAKVKPAFGRGEIIHHNGKHIQIILVKNPAGFRQALIAHDEKEDVFIAINDDYADGRDVSWLWDVDFSALKSHGVDMVSGTRAYDMALRLRYEEVSALHVIRNITSALDHYLANSKQPRLKIYATYTAMLAIRNYLIGNRDLGESS